jgi:hypothetical protein
MPKIVIIEKSGNVKTISVKDFANDTLYKKAGLKSGEGFVLQHTWGAEDGLDQSIQLYAKKTGRAGQENKYDFPPPVDEVLFFGPCVLVGTDRETGNVVDLEEEDWEEIYEFLFGGFEDLDSEEDSDLSEEVNTDDEFEAIQKTTGIVVEQTKQGYAKDGFIVEDGEEEEEEDDDDESEESVDTPPKKALTKGRKPGTAKSNAGISTGTSTNTNIHKSVPVQPDTILNMEDCENELSEEEYE